MRTKHVEMVIRIDYYRDSKDDDIKNQLHFAAHSMAGNGLLSGAGHLGIVRWECDIRIENEAEGSR